MPLVRKILVPVDPSPCSTAALQFAALLAEELGASLDVLHVHEHGGFDVGSTAPLAPDVLKELERGMEHAVEQARTRLGERFSQRSEPGEPLRRILEAAGGGGYDMIVMGTHGRIGRLHMLLGSVAEGVVRNAPCPVLTLRVPEGEESFAERLRGGPTIARQVRSGG